jgi:hypothetical protein
MNDPRKLIDLLVRNSGIDIRWDKIYILLDFFGKENPIGSSLAYKTKAHKFDTVIS